MTPEEQTRAWELLGVEPSEKQAYKATALKHHLDQTRPVAQIVTTKGVSWGTSTIATNTITIW